ncbi:hypothetical protein MMPV_002099 [Pyropia vietnamensis]
MATPPPSTPTSPDALRQYRSRRAVGARSVGARAAAAASAAASGRARSPSGTLLSHDEEAPPARLSASPANPGSLSPLLPSPDAAATATTATASGTVYGDDGPPEPAAPPAPMPDRVHTLTDVQAWLSALGYARYGPTFAANEITGDVLRTLTSDELRDDLGVRHLRHRRDLLDAISALLTRDAEARSSPTTTEAVDALPEHGRILDHLSNVRSYHSWMRVGVQMLGFAIVTLRLTPKFRERPLVTAASLYFAAIGIGALLYGVYRYRQVIGMIERSGAKTPAYDPDRYGVLGILFAVLTAAVFVLVIILIDGF